jgi:4-amino-4-deoxy-L-arabinose transferase-like glycosyltransferase
VIEAYIGLFITVWKLDFTRLGHVSAIIVLPSSYSSLSTWLRHHVILASLIVLVFSACPRIFFASRSDPSELIISISDAATYLIPAQNLIERGAFLNERGEPEVERTPGYPTFLATLMFVVGRDLRKVFIAQAIVLSFGVVVLYWLARRILPPITAFIGVLLAAFSPWGAVLAVVPLTEGLFLVLLNLILFITKLIEETRNPVTGILGSASLGLLTAAAVLVRPLWPLVVLVSAVLFLCCGPKRKGVWVLTMVMLVCAVTPLSLWKERNKREGHFDSFSAIPGITAWLYLASRVKAQVNGEDRFTVSRMARQEESNWGLAVQEADDERWRRAKAVFQEHPILTVYCFLRSAAEHAIHPSPNVLTPAKLNFPGDYRALALLWGGLLTLACAGWQYILDPEHDNGEIDRPWLMTMLVICLLLTVTSGITFGQGSRLRAPMELIIPLLAGVGLSYAFQRVPIRSLRRLLCRFPRLNG